VQTALQGSGSDNIFFDNNETALSRRTRRDFEPLLLPFSPLRRRDWGRALPHCVRRAIQALG